MNFLSLPKKTPKINNQLVYDYPRLEMFLNDSTKQ